LAEDGSWPSIRQNGLLSTESLLDLFEVDPARKEELLTTVRRESSLVEHPTHGTAVVRDQKPMSLSKLEACLEGMKPEEWLSCLNQRVFFWLQEARLERMMQAPPYRGREHLVLVVDTARLVDAHQESIVLSRINSGATLFDPPSRGKDTFRPIADYDHPNRARALAGASDVAELAVLGGVPDISDVVIRAERRQVGRGVIEVIWEGD
jgi:hypothetical protein